MNPTNHTGEVPNFEGEEMKMPVGVTPANEPAPESVVNLPIVILLVGILILLLGGIYYWYTIIMATPVPSQLPVRPTASENNEPESTTAEARTAATDVVSTSDDLDAIGADIESTRTDDLDADMAALETELGGALETETAPTLTTPEVSAADPGSETETAVTE